MDLREQLLRDPHFRFLSITPDGDRAFQAYEHVQAYCRACELQYERVHERWSRVSTDGLTADQFREIFPSVQREMRQVIRDVHFLFVAKQVVWKALDRLGNSTLYPSFSEVRELRDRWQPYFEQYLDPRNTFEHFDDQILGPDTRGNSPGYGVRLTERGMFALGRHDEVPVNESSKAELARFFSEFEALMFSIADRARESRRREDTAT
jgi:hypothetical protein